MNAPSMQDATARLAVAIAFARRGDQARAWALFAPLLAGDLEQNHGVERASVLFWAARSVPSAQAPVAVGLRQQLLALPGAGIEIGLAWAEEAQRREQAGASAHEVQMAWERSGLALPKTHAWQPTALLRAARLLITQDTQWASAMKLLEEVEAEGEGEDRRRCRFLLSQAYEHLARPAQALQIIDELRPTASADQREKLDRMRLRLAQATMTEVQPGPLDAEN
jgi:hypothetical protein